MLKGLALRFGLPMLALLGLATWLAVPYVDRILTEWFKSDIEARSKLVMRSIEEALTPLLAKPSPAQAAQIQRVLSRVTADERVIAIAVCTRSGTMTHRTERTPPELVCPTGAISEPAFQLVTARSGLLHVARFPLEQQVGEVSHVAIVHDLSFVDRRQTRARDYLIAFSTIAALGVVALCILIAWWVLRSWVQRLVRDIRQREYLADPESGRRNDTVLDQVRSVMREVERAQQMEFDFRENWTADALRHVVEEQLGGTQLIVVSNREPYIHNVVDGKVVVQYPASGMVTALEPVVRACSGVWVAHGSGDADRKVVDPRDRIQVPPNDPSYTLRRVWLTEEEEEGYYYGFSNEGLWPLCHLAFVRPAFRPADWKQYVTVNQRFADAVVQEARTPRPVILVQDYHFALLPQLLRERLPQATIVVFWHIPWPNAEAFGICPWQRELLRSMLAADIVGFHTRHHCHNFLATVDRSVECHIDREHGTVTRKGHTCQVDAYPISIEWPPRWLEHAPPVAECRARVMQRYGLRPDTKIVLGIERWDFTKGILERLAALERLLKSSPEWRGRVVMLQIAAPSRSKLRAYRELQRVTQQTAARINDRFATADYRPVVLLSEHHNPEQVFELYRACDVCIVNSLHDGMNLVAKEFVAARSDEDGVLVLSTFAGASRELREAVVVNPYDIDETAQALGRALVMPREERQERLRIMRATIKHNNVFRWAGRMLMDAARIRQRQRLRGFDGEREAGLRAEVRRLRQVVPPT